MHIVLMVGLEPTRLATPDSKSDGSTIPPHELVLLIKESIGKTFVPPMGFEPTLYRV